MQTPGLGMGGLRASAGAHAQSTDVGACCGCQTSGRRDLSPFCPQLAESAPAQGLQAGPGTKEKNANVSAGVALVRGI